MLPIIDVLSNAFIRNDLTVFDHIQTHRAEECAQLRIMFCTEEPGAVSLDLAVDLSSSVNITSSFKGPRAWFFSRQTRMQQSLSQGQSSLPIEFAFGIDTHFAQAIFDFIHQKNTNNIDRRSIIDVLKLKSKHANIHFDVMPILFEHVRHHLITNDMDTLIDAITSIKMLDYIDWQRFNDDPEQLYFTRALQTIKQRIQPDITSILETAWTHSLVSEQNTLCRLNRAVLLRFTRLWLEHRHQGTDAVLNRLLHWCISQFGFLPLHLLSLLWSGTIFKEHNPFFDPLIHPTTHLFQIVENMAWQITHLRWLEEAAASSLHGTFNIPYSVSCQDNWHQLLSLNPIQCMLIDSEKGIINLLRVHERRFNDAICSCLDKRYQRGMNPRDFEYKIQGETTLCAQQLHQLIQEEEHDLSQARLSLYPAPSPIDGG